MARLFSCGFELQSVTANVEFTTTAGSPTIDTTTKRSGAAALRCNASAAEVYFGKEFSASNVDGPLYVRTYIYIATAPSALTTLINIGGSTSDNGGRIRLATDRTLELWDLAAKVGSSSSVIPLNEWHLVEIYYKHVGAETGELTGKLDGTSFASSTTLTLTSVDYLTIGVRTSTTADVYFDDIALNDSTGTSQNSWAGSGKIIHLAPNAAGDANLWQKSGGGVGDANNYQDVDEAIPDDATTYLRSTTLNDEDFYNCIASGIGASDTVSLVQVGSRFSSSGSVAPTFKVECKKTSGGTIAQGTGVAVTTAGWKTNAYNSPFAYQLTLYNDPDGNSWTQATLDTMQIGMKLTTDATPLDWISTLWALVEYIPVSPSSAPTGENWPILTGNKFQGWRY